MDMFYRKIRRSGALLLAFCMLIAGMWRVNLPPAPAAAFQPEPLPTASTGFIKWVDFDIPCSAMEKAMDADIKSHEAGKELSWIDLLAMLATRYGGNWKLYKSKDLSALIGELEAGKKPEELMAGYQHYSYYQEAYTAVLGSFLGEHRREAPDKLNEGEKRVVEKYGLKVYSPIAEGFGYSHYDDFGNSRDYGYRRVHLGNDLIGAVGTPICAVEAGIVDHLGWNQYGGWRVGIRSLDGKRYYYYAHLRKDSPYHIDLKEGRLVKAGEVIGYLGMTGYSARANVSNMKTPHLHFGMQLIFDPSQEEGKQEIWIDVYQLVELLKRSRATVDRDEESRQYYRRYDIFDPQVEAYIEEHPGCRS